MDIAIIGAGLAGLTAAGELQRAGHAVQLWEKSRGVGGRTATRRGPDGMRFDHGAPFLHDGAAPLRGIDALAAHELRFADGTTRAAAVGAPSANAPAKALADGLRVHTGVRVAAIEEAGSGFSLADEDGTRLGRFDAVIVTAPAPQAATLLQHAAPGLAARAASVDFAPCWSVMAAWPEPLGLDVDVVAAVQGLDWAVAEAPKPGRDAGERWVLQADAALSARLLEDDAEAVGPLLLARFAAAVGAPLPTPDHLAAHRWRFSRPTSPLPELVLGDGPLVAAGDWCGGDTAGAAIRSGRAAAAALLRLAPGAPAALSLPG